MTRTSTPVEVTEHAVPARSRGALLGLVAALGSALAFGSSGTFGRSLIDTGWSPGAIVTARIGGAALLLLIPGLISMRGHWGRLRTQLPALVAYGLIGVAGCQLAYFYAVERLSVGVALLLEYLGPVLIVAWVWLRTRRAPHPLTLIGAAAAVAGLLLVLDVASGAKVDLLGVGYGLLAAAALAVFFMLAARTGQEALPPLAYASGGMLTGALSLAVAAGVGVLPMRTATGDVRIAGTDLPWWVAVGELVVVAAALAYVLGVVAARVLGPTVASFVGLSEVLFAIIIAWVLLGQSMSLVQGVGGLVVVAGVALVKVGEARRARSDLSSELVLVSGPAPVSVSDCEECA
ncbi:EamA family transporter [Dermacoccaceae bacterium W4C1]